MSADSLSRPSLERLARRKGVLVRYRDGFRRECTASTETLLAVLQQLSVPIRSLEDADAALRREDLQRWRALAPPAAVSWGGNGLSLMLRLPAALGTAAAEWSLRLETGDERSGSVVLADLPQTSCIELGRDRFLSRRFSLPDRLPIGYHRLQIRAGPLSAGTAVLAAPRRCWQTAAIDRSWGVFLPLYALHSKHSWGAGSFSDLGRLFDWVQNLGGRFVGALPLLSAYLDEPFEYSPYVPASRLFWNEFYVDPRETPEWERSPPARQALARTEASGELQRFRSNGLIDYRGQAVLRREVLRELTAAALAHPERRAQLAEFADSQAQLREYAAFRAAVEANGPPSTSWPQSCGDFDPSTRDLHLYAQWVADAQLTSLAQKAGEPGLYLDLPLGVHSAGYDVWRNPDCYAAGPNGGAPPDRFFTQGQNWGFSPLHPERIRRDGYRHVAHIVRSHLRHAGILRVDHFMWLHRLYWIPEGAAAADGTYVQFPADELYAVLSIESNRSKSMVVGEDLGTVPAYVRDRMGDRGIDRMYVAQFSFQPDKRPPLKAAQPETLASVNTHDTPTWAGFWSGADIDDQISMGLLTDAEAAKARERRAELRRVLCSAYGCEADAQAVLLEILDRLARSKARAVLVNLEDLWGETEPQNTPGTGPERPNWQRRAALSLEQMQQDSAVLRALELLNSGRRL